MIAKSLRTGRGIADLHRNIGPRHTDFNLFGGRTSRTPAADCSVGPVPPRRALRLGENHSRRRTLPCSVSPTTSEREPMQAASCSCALHSGSTSSTKTGPGSKVRDERVSLPRGSRAEGETAEGETAEGETAEGNPRGILCVRHAEPADVSRRRQGYGGPPHAIVTAVATPGRTLVHPRGKPRDSLAQASRHQTAHGKMDFHGRSC